MKKLIKLVLTLFISFGLQAMPKAVLFDCDGVLVDSEHMKFEAWREALRAENIELTLQDYMAVVGGSSKAIAKSIAESKNCNFDATKVISHKDTLYKAANAHGVKPILPAVNYLNTLLKQKEALDLKIAVVSSDSHENILHNLKQANVKTELLDGVFSGHDDLNHINDPEGTNKPKPYIYELAANKLGIAPMSIVVFEDTNAGVISASLAGMHVIATPNRFTQQHDFSKAVLVTTFDKFTLNDLQDY